MRWFFVLIGTVLVVTAVACGSDDDDASDDAGTQGTATTASDQDDGRADNGDADGGDNGDDDLEAVAEDLEPPSAREVYRASAADGFSIAYESDKSVDDLKDYYEDRFDELGINVLSTTSVDEGQSWVFGDEDGGGVQGIVTITSSEDGKAGVFIVMGLPN